MLQQLHFFCFELKMGSRVFDRPYDLMESKDFQERHTHSLIDRLPSMYHTNHVGYYTAKFKEMLDAYLDPEPTTQNYLSAIIIQILYRFNQEIRNEVDHSHKKAEEIKKSD